MTQVTVPVAGDPATISWAQDVANHANHVIPLYMSADVNKTSSSFSDITGLTFAVTNGKCYSIRLQLSYTVGGTSTGLSIGFSSPGGTCRLFTRIYGNGSATGVTSEVLSSSDTATGTSSTDSTALRLIEVFGTFVCTSDGTFALRYNRNGTSTTVTVYAGSGGIVVES